MKYIWKTTMPDSYNDPKQWSTVVLHRFGLLDYEFNQNVLNDKDELCIIRTRFKSMFHSCYEYRSSGSVNYELENIEGCNLTLTDVFPRFSRYENKCFLFIVLDLALVLNDYDLIEYYQQKVKSQLDRRFGDIVQHTFEVNFTVEKYVETIQIQNPIPIVENQKKQKLFNHLHHKKCETELYNRYYLVKYVNENDRVENKKYVRELKVIYELIERIGNDGKDINKLNKIYDIIHSKTFFS